MHGMINRALQTFLVATYGDDVWQEVREVADLPFEDFESMLSYDDALTVACFQAACDVTTHAPDVILEDMGTFMITHPPLDPLRRLLRFGGGTFRDFILSLDELADRGRMAMPTIEMPDITVRQINAMRYEVRATWVLPGIGAFLRGALQAMADDYGSLATLTRLSREGNADGLRVEVHDLNHSRGNRFDLAGALL